MPSPQSWHIHIMAGLAKNSLRPPTVVPTLLFCPPCLSLPPPPPDGWAAPQESGELSGQHPAELAWGTGPGWGILGGQCPWKAHLTTAPLP